MTLTELIPLVIKGSIALLVFSLALQATPQDATYLLRRPGLLARSLLSMNIVMPLFAVLVAALFELHPAIEITIIALALSPVPPILPGKQTKAGGNLSYAIGLLVAAALLALVIVPLGVALIGSVFSKDIHVSASTVAPVVLVSVLLPLAAGLAVRRFAPTVAEKIARPVSLVAIALLVIAAVPVIIGSGRGLISMVGNGTLVVLALFTVVGLAIGHVFGGPESGNRTDLALATATRHPGLALTIASAAFPDEKAVMIVVIWHLVVGAIVSVPYVLWRKRRNAQSAAVLLSSQEKNG